MYNKINCIKIPVISRRIVLDSKKIDRINALAKKAKAEGLTDEELKERDELRKEYLAAIRSNFKSVLDSVEITDK